MGRVLVTFLFLFPVLIFALSMFGVFTYTPFGSNVHPETDVQVLDNAMRSGSWLLIGWLAELVIIKVMLIIGDRLFRCDGDVPAP